MVTRMTGDIDRRPTVVGGKASRNGSPLTMEQRVTSANTASTGTRPRDVRPLQDNDGDYDDD